MTPATQAVVLGPWTPGARIPVALESVRAGFPSVAQDYAGGDLSLDERLVEHPETTFVVRVAGESMTGAGIFDGDLLIVDRSLEPRDGDVVVAVLDGELTVKRLLHDAHGWYLHAEHPGYPDFRPDRFDEGCLWSNKAVRCRHLFWTVMAFILDSVGGRHRCDMRAPVPLVS